MKHLYSIDEYTEVYVADTPEQAVEYYREICNQEPEFVEQIPDNQQLTIDDPNNLDIDRFEGTAAEFANEFNEPSQVFTSYN